MAFVFPSFLWAFLLLSIPLIIHLFNFRKTKKVYFSNNRLLKQIKQQTTQRRRLKQLLVLASRLLFLFFLVVAFAQPFLPAKEQLTSGHQVIIYLDNSQSMSGKVAEKSRAIDDALARIKEITSAFPLESRFKLITNDFAPFSNQFKTKVEVEDILSSVRLSPISRTFEEIKNRMEIEKSALDIFWISDFQQSTQGEIAPVDSLNQWHLVPISFGKSIPNIYVDSVYQDNPFAIAGEKNTISVNLKNNGADKRQDVVVKLQINNAQSATTTVNIEPYAVATATFDLPAGLKQMNQAKFVVSDFPVSFDNEFFFTINFSEKIKVVEIKTVNAKSPIEAVFGNKQLFAVHSLMAANINYGLVKEADFVVLNGLPVIDASLRATLEEYQQKGGSVMLVPAAKPDLSTYRFLVKNRTFLLAGKVESQDLAKPDFQNPFYNHVFEEKSATLLMPKGSKLLDWGGDRSAILAFKDGQPFLSIVGNTVILSAPLEVGYTDFHNHALFVPIMYRLAGAGRKESRPLYYSLEQSFITIKGDSLPTEGQLKLQGDKELVPVQRRNGDKVVLELPRYLINKGFYRVTFNQDTVDLIGLNLSKKESVMNQLSGEEMKTALGGGKNISVFKADNADSFGSEMKERYKGVQLWKQALLLALLFLLAEVLLIRFLK